MASTIRALLARKNEILSRKKEILGYAIFFVAVALLTWWMAPLFTRERLEVWVRGAGIWGPLLLFGLQIAQILFAPVPGVFVPLLAGAMYGPYVGLLATIAGTLIGSALAYTIGRHAGHPFVARWLGAERLEKGRLLLRGKRWLGLAVTFLFPFSPVDLLCFVAGVVRMQRLGFFLAVLVGRIPKDGVLTLVGAGLISLGS